MKKALFIFLIVHCTLIIDNCYAGRIYLNPTYGKDTANGRNINYPIRILQRAGVLCQNGDSILIRGNGNPQYVNHDSSHFVRSNPQNFRVYIMNFPGESVILDGFNSFCPSWDGMVTPAIVIGLSP